jgi:hypothetical protein
MTAARRTAFISERADAEIDATPACEPLPIASRVAARTVAAASGSEMAARAPSAAKSATIEPAVGAIPRRTSRFFNRSRARESRTLTVPTGQHSRAAAWA